MLRRASLKDDFPTHQSSCLMFKRNKQQIKYGGGGRIRTIEGSAGRFTVCSLWPLGNPSRVFFMLQRANLKDDFPTHRSSCLMFKRNKQQIKYGGGGRIRTIEGSAGRFTVCSLWPLGNPSRVFFMLQRANLKDDFPTHQSSCLMFKRNKQQIKYGGGGRIRTIEGSAGRFTVCSLWPLGNPSRVFFMLLRANLKDDFPTHLSSCLMFKRNKQQN